ncbi:MAG: membrane protein insertion efficiency factor YidD [Candidatus Poribacteria bacterium]|nr:membrane protein insertion efficiency factor YidD [Candidatus Poribacteria bacterium]
MVKYRICHPFVLFWTMCFITALLTMPSHANEATDLAFIRQVNPITKEIPKESIRFNPQESSELKLAATGLIRLYQKFISSQDAPTCQFIPSCSRFGTACIQEFGMFRGILLTADRLIRCNGSQSSHYHRDLNTGKYIDPISDYAK